MTILVGRVGDHGMGRGRHTQGSQETESLVCDWAKNSRVAGCRGCLKI